MNVVTLAEKCRVRKLFIQTVRNKTFELHYYSVEEFNKNNNKKKIFF